MIKKRWITLLLLTIMMVTGCQKKIDGLDQHMVEEKAKSAAVDYLKKKKKIDFVVDEYEFLDTTATSTVVVHGHEKGKKKNQFGVFVNYRNNFKVGMIGSGKVESNN
ncbi:hypothetical protein [Priestia koreensis]|uniref:hypothetical protein n=1 Tax=Priestia koreensis TaxID=284581 RepID=UPI001F5646BC|nr:hypothetical protein [Priestia koreensis]UNL86986.1 hypothetical protein IE339_11075 [Priestia koreensis]